MAGKGGAEIKTNLRRLWRRRQQPSVPTHLVGCRTDAFKSRRNMIEYSRFRSSLKRLEEQHRNYQRGNPLLSELDREGIAESVIQRFETCYDCLWRVLKRYLVEELGIADPPNSPKPVFRLAYENGLFAAPVAQWLQHADARIGTAHDYDGLKAQACLAVVPVFIDDAIRLYQLMSSELWK